MSKTTRMMTTAIGLVAVAALAVGPAIAQEETASEQESSRILAPVTVTAQKIEQNLQDVGVSVTAYSGAQLTALGFNNSVDLIAQTPGLQASGYGGGALNSFNIRGVGQNDFAANQEAPIALYVDEVYQSSNVTTRFALFDIERAEVLRGPQGTLFGRNSTGGLVHYITAKPTEDFEGFAQFTIGEQGRRRVEAAVGGGIADGVAFRLSANHNENDGLMENDIGPNQMQQDDSAVRAQLLLEPTSDLRVLFKAQYAKEDDAPGGYSFGLPPYNATDFFGYVDADGDPFTISQDGPSFKKSEAVDLTSTVNWDLGWADLTSVTNYQDIDDSYGEDADASPNSVFNYGQETAIKQVSQEVRLNFDGERHQSVVGVYFLNIDGDYSTRQFGDAFFGPDVFQSFATQETTTYAVFAQTEYSLTDKAALTLGLRYNKDEKDYSLVSADFGFPMYSDTLEEDDFSGKVQIDYRATDDVLLYAGINRGTKSGGFNLPLTPADPTTLQYDGEKLTSYEIGAKTSFGNYARLNTAVFYYDYQDYQAYNIDAFFNTLLFNADAQFSGAEVELILNPADGLDIMLGASYLDTEVTGLPTDFNTFDPITFAPAQNFPTGAEKAPLAPELSLNGLVRYERPAFGGTVAIQGDFNWQSEHKFNLASSPVTREGSYGVLNAKLGYTSGDDRWSASVFVKNLTDERYRTFGVDGTLFFGSQADIFGPKKWFGADLRVNF
tara:strand:- start:1769 stop:3937 length:2169 start_codon:yes stop_codon:yes gene_type:complete